MDVEDLIHYIKTLKKGFDTDLFKSKIEELTYIAERTGLESDDFHILFKIWLNLSIPFTKWVSLGSCLMPQDKIEERTVDYAFRWLLANFENHTYFSRMSFVLDWLTAALDSASVDMEVLDNGYEILYTLMSLEILTPHVIKLVYTLTKPSDVTRRRVLELLEYAKKREGKKNMYRQIQVILGLFKSYKPECVPEDVPAISVHASFKKINDNLVQRFKRSQERRNSSATEREHLKWISSESCRNKKADPLVPNMQLSHIGGKRDDDQEVKKSYLDFSDAGSLLQYSLQHPMLRPARLRSLLCNETGMLLLAIATDSEQEFLSHDLYHTLCSSFLESSPHSYMEKRDFLHRVAVLQRTLMQAIPLVTRFLAQYLPLWNEKDYFGEILELVEWSSADSAAHLSYIVDVLVKVHHRAQPMEQCAIATSLTNMYTNLVFASTRRRHHFMSATSQSISQLMMTGLATKISEMFNKELQINPDDVRAMCSGVTSFEAMSRAELRCKVSPGALPRPLTLALPLITPSAVILDKIAALLLLYRKILSSMKSSTDPDVIEIYTACIDVLQCYTVDITNCLCNENVISDRDSGVVFTKLSPKLVEELKDIPQADAMFSIKNSLAFLPYNYDLGIECLDAKNRLLLDTVVGLSFPRLRTFLMKAIPK